MSRITKEEIEKTKCGRFLLSDENIYLSIYSLNSYVFEYNLLNTEDRILYHRLQDKFDARLINGVITRVREQIIELFDKDKYIEAKVYFKPKKLSENGELEFRPLHSTGLITQIAIVSMLHLFVYEIPEEEEGDPKLRLSNLSRLIPSDFYGNRVSVKPEYLFKPWKQQYQKYNQNSNDALMKYHTSLEYKYEVTLDLENFFPTINPIIIYRYIINHLPAYLNDEERKMMKRVLQKLLFCKLTTTFDEKTAGQYYKVTKGAGNYDNVDKIEQNEKECWAFKEKSDKFVRGIPQGLPQSYFLGNIYMISIAEIFRKKFTGVSYFYVDDSVIFTNDVREDNFKEQLKELNKQIADEAIYNDPYKTLKYLARVRLKRYANKHYEVAEDYSSKLLKKTDEEILKILLSENEKLPSRLRIVCASTQKIIRMVLNTVCSYLFNVEVSNHPVLAQNSKKALTYGELRILSFVRNSLFTIEEFRKREILLDDKQNKDTADYSIMKVLEIYHSFVKDPVSIDKLIITHKYTCDVWKNGSKHLYFYTLHNQEHAIVLIQNIVKLIHAIDFLKISAIDYYILFLACYLHDISMVKIPALDSFLTDTNEADELAQELLDEFNKELQKDNLEEKVTENEIKENQNLYEDELDILSVKKYMLESYKKLDEYFEKKIRRRHAIDSSSEIRQRAEIKYLDMPMRELVAEVSEAHGADERNIYSIKSNASSRLMWQADS